VPSTRPTDSLNTLDDATGTMRSCAEEGCDEPAAVRLHVPWAENREVCPAHARPIARKDGVVAEPLEGAEGEWP
jgi:hypothetical protein